MLDNDTRVGTIRVVVPYSINGPVELLTPAGKQLLRSLTQGPSQLVSMAHMPESTIVLSDDEELMSTSRSIYPYLKIIVPEPPSTSFRAEALASQEKSTILLSSDNEASNAHSITIPEREPPGTSFRTVALAPQGKKQVPQTKRRNCIGNSMHKKKHAKSKAKGGLKMKMGSTERNPYNLRSMGAYNLQSPT